MTSGDIETKAAAGDTRAQIELAAKLDGEGRHTDAINWLARAGKAGDSQALTLLALRLLTGRDAPFLPADGARLLSDAAGAGHAGAAGHLAVLLGGGFFVKQDWRAALAYLVRSAELGSQAAQAQLRILADRGDDESDFKALAAAIDLKTWVTPPEGRTLSEQPLVRAVQAVIPARASAWVIEQAKARLVRAELYDPNTGAAVQSQETRQNRIANFTLADTNLLNLLIQARIAAAVGCPQPMLEAFAVLHYAVGEEYGEHFDFLDPAIPAYADEIQRQGQRVATLLLYLNDNYEGGTTDFPELGISHRGAAGDGLIFASVDPAGRPDRRTRHAGRPPKTGEKWLLSQFIRNRPQVGVQSAPR